MDSIKITSQNFAKMFAIIMTDGINLLPQEEEKMQYLLTQIKVIANYTPSCIYIESSKKADAFLNFQALSMADDLSQYFTTAEDLVKQLIVAIERASDAFILQNVFLNKFKATIE